MLPSLRATDDSDSTFAKRDIPSQPVLAIIIHPQVSAGSALPVLISYLPVDGQYRVSLSLDTPANVIHPLTTQQSTQRQVVVFGSIPANTARGTHVVTATISGASRSWTIRANIYVCSSFCPPRIAFMDPTTLSVSKEATSRTDKP